MKTIVVPTDFSPAAANATNYAVSMALQIDASILLLHVYQLPVAINEDPPILISVDELKGVAETRLEALKKDLERVSPGKLKIEIAAQLGTVHEALGRLCEKEQPFAVIMGTTGHSTVDRILFGSTIKSVIRHLVWPVIGVPKGKVYGHGIRNAGLVVDFRELTETLPLSDIRSFIEIVRSGLYIFNLDIDDALDKESKPVRSVLLETVFSGHALQYHSTTSDNFEGNINSFVETNSLDLLISIPKKHKFLEGLFKKDSTDQLLFHSSVPLMSVHTA